MSETQPTADGAPVRPAGPKASVVKFKAALRRETRKRRKEPEVDFLNITAMLDLMTIILVFMLQTMASSAGAIKESDDLALARSVIGGEPSDKGVLLVISKSAILIGEEGQPVVTLPSRAQLASQGLDAQHKRSGPNDLYIVPLARRLENARKLDEAFQRAKGVAKLAQSEAIIIADGTTPYRLLLEVLYTLGQSEFGRYHLMVMKKSL
jgi:biopolymer transport protein ExbD